MPKSLPRCTVVPLPDDQASFQVEGNERLRWHFDGKYPRPFFYPLVGPSGSSLTRMGHPGDAGHDHHRSVWFAHHDVAGLGFWNDAQQNKPGPPRVRQKRWLVYHDADDAAVMGALLGWYDGDREIMEQELIVAVGDRFEDVALRGGETIVELQTAFRPTAETIALGKTNFGFLALRMAKSISAHFGDGAIIDSEGRRDEPAIFGNSAAWMDYSGGVPGGKTEGVTYFDHPANASYPSKWHVREDGWMGASVCRDGPRTIRREEPLVLRYLLHAHAGPLDAKRASALAAAFGHWPAWRVEKSPAKHQGHRVARLR